MGSNRQRIPPTTFPSGVSMFAASSLSVLHFRLPGGALSCQTETREREDTEASDRISEKNLSG